MTDMTHDADHRDDQAEVAQRPEQEHERWEGYTDRELKRFEFERKLAEARNVVPLRPDEPVDLVEALVDGVQREAARRAVRRSCEIAIVAAFDRGDPAHAVNQLRAAIAVITALSLTDQPPEAS